VNHDGIMGSERNPGFSTEAPLRRKKFRKRPSKRQRAFRAGPEEVQSPNIVQNGGIRGKGDRKEINSVLREAGFTHVTWFYQSARGLSALLQPLFRLPIEVLALSSKFYFFGADIIPGGEMLLSIYPPPRPDGASLHEHLALWSEHIHQTVGSMVARNPGEPLLRRYRRQFEVLEFMRATWDACLTCYQVERHLQLHHSLGYLGLNSERRSGINRFRRLLVYKPLRAAQRLKECASACRLWYFGGPRPSQRVLCFSEKIVALHASYAARCLPPAPSDPSGLEGLNERLTSEPPPEEPGWRNWVKGYVQRWRPKRFDNDLYTMPSGSAGIGFPRYIGGHARGVKYLLLLGYALTRDDELVDPPDADEDGRVKDRDVYFILKSSWPEQKYLQLLFHSDWEQLRDPNLGLTRMGLELQRYLRRAVEYVLDSLDIIPVLPLAATERGLKTRFPTCSLTAVNLVQQILRRVIDCVMVNDPRFSEALGGSRDVDLRGEDGPWYSQDCTAATDFHPQWLTQGVYEELAEADSRLRPYKRFYNKLFGPKLMIRGVPSDYMPTDLIRRYPDAPLIVEDSNKRLGHIRSDAGGHRLNIRLAWDDWLTDIKAIPGVVTRTGQMMGDPTSFPVLMLVSLRCADLTLETFPYSRRAKRKAYLRKRDAVLKGCGDDAVLPRWHEQRRLLYNRHLERHACVISWKKSFHDAIRGLIAEIPLEQGYLVPFWPLSVLVAPPGGSKGTVRWWNQVSAFCNDPTRPNLRVPAFFWRLSPYWYDFMLCRRLGIPVGAPVAFGGLGLPHQPKVSLTHHTQWLRYLSQRSVTELVGGLGLTPFGRADRSLLDSAMKKWLDDVVRTDRELSRWGSELLSPVCVGPDSLVFRVSLRDGYLKSLGQLRSMEFYFRIPPSERRTPSVRRWARRFQAEVEKAVPATKVTGYGPTARDLDRKTNVFFAQSQGLLPNPSERLPSVYGLERSGLVRERFQHPFAVGLG